MAVIPRFVMALWRDMQLGGLAEEVAQMFAVRTVVMRVMPDVRALKHSEQDGWPSFIFFEWHSYQYNSERNWENRGGSKNLEDDRWMGE